MMKRRRKGLEVVALVVASIAAGQAKVEAIEPAREFLEGLRERKYYDVALDYLDAAAANPAVPASFKESLLYEKGVTLVEGAREQRDTGLREKQLDDGQATLKQFIEQQPNHSLAIAARSQLGNVSVERARIRVERAKKLSASEKAALHKEARGLYDEAGKVFAALVEELREKLKSYPAALDPKKDAKRVEERDRLRMDFLQAQLLTAAAREESAETMEPKSKEWTEALTKAAEEYKRIYEDYRTRLAGLYASMYEGRCLQKLGKHKEASAVFNQLLANPDDPEAFRTLKIKAMALAVDSWLAQGLYAEVLSKAQPLVDSARPSEDRGDEMMQMRVGIARASKGFADELKKKNPKDPQIKRLLGDGRKYATYAARFPGIYQDAARKLIPDLAGGDIEVAERKDPTTFQEASTAAKEAIEGMQAANLLIRTLPGRIASSKSPEKEELTKQLEEAKQQVQSGQADAMEYCRLALKLADKETSLDDVNLIRYLLCYLLYNEQKYLDAAVIGEFLARRTESQGARPSAKIAMASYLKLYTENQTDDKEFESNQIIGIADFIVKKWPDQPEAAEALNTLIPFMIREKKLKEAQDYLQQIPEDSPHRGGAELKTGQALWASYLESSRQVRDWENQVEPAPPDVDLPARKAELETLKNQAKETLVQGVARMQQQAEVNEVLATAALSLAQIYVDTNDAAKAVALLEDPKIGPLTLVKADHAAAQREGYAEETYKTALRAYISSLAAGAPAAETIDKAKGVMESLKERMAQTPQGQGKLVAIYVSLARDLQQQMEIAEPAVKKTLGLGFENFLGEVAKDATELNVLNWVAETYRGMGESYGSTLKSLTPEAKGYFTKAAETYQKVLDKGKADPKFFTTPGMENQVKMQLAKTKKSMGDYIAARNAYEEILKANPMLLPVQIEAARLYQDWGGTGKGQAPNYLKAIVGDRPDAAKRGKNTIWGWGEIARMTASNKQFEDQFYEARYNLALCRYNYALAQADAAKKAEVMQRALNDVKVTVAFYENLGEKWTPLFDNLTKNIQKGLGERPVGISALKVPAAGSKVPITPTSAPAKSGAK